jgi:hypothetical protein
MNFLNKGCPLTEFTIESVIRDGLGELRANPTLLDDLFGKFNRAFFEFQYGQSKIDEIKKYVLENQIKIVHAYTQQPYVNPCFSIQLTNSVEDPSRQQLSNEFLDLDVVKDQPDIISANVIPTSYNPVTGRMDVDNSADLSNVCPGLDFEDANGIKYRIGSGNSNFSGNKYLNIGVNQTPPALNLTGQVLSQVEVERTERRMVRLNETISLGCHAKDDIHLVKYLYYILYYILKKRQKNLIDRGILLDYESNSIFNREQDFQGENVYSRYIQINCITEFHYEDDKATLVDCFDPTIKASGINSDDSVITSPSDPE